VIVAGGEQVYSVTQTRLDTTQFRIRFFHKIYDKEELGSIMGHFGPVNALSFSPDGRSFASGAEDGFVRLHHFDESYFRYNDELNKPPQLLKFLQNDSRQ
jgi:translation initiation factor 3 subunit I